MGKPSLSKGPLGNKGEHRTLTHLLSLHLDRENVEGTEERKGGKRRPLSKRTLEAEQSAKRAHTVQIRKAQDGGDPTR